MPQMDCMLWTLEQNPIPHDHNLSHDEVLSIQLYTLEWTPREKSFYFLVNTALRSENREQLQPWLPYLRLLMNALSKLPSNPHQIAYRGIPLDVSKEYFVDKEFVWWSFISCTSSLQVLKNYIGRTGKRTIFNIVCYSPKDISQYSFYEEEKEVLFYPARQFRVKSCLNAGNQLHIIDLEELRHKTPLFSIPSVTALLPNELNRSITIVSLQRAAIESFADLGSAYDLNRDCVTYPYPLNANDRQSQLHRTTLCQITRHDTNQSPNLLKLFLIQDDLRLSILLRFTPKTSITTLLHHPHPIDRYTRFLYYSYTDRQEQLSSKTTANKLFSQNNAAHIITAIIWGIKFLVILQLPPDDPLTEEIDHALQSVQTLFSTENRSAKLSAPDVHLLGKIVHTRIYSNTPQLAEMTSLIDLCRYKDLLKRKSYLHRPLTYTLQAIQGQDSPSNRSTTTLLTTLTLQIEQYLMEQFHCMMTLKSTLDDHRIRLPSSYLKKQFDEGEKQWQRCKDLCAQEINFFANLVFRIRCGQDDPSIVEQTMSSQGRKIVFDSIRYLKEYIGSLEVKEQFIQNLQQKRFQYYDLTDRAIGPDETEQTLKQKLIRDDRCDRILCSTDILNLTNPGQFNSLSDQLIREYQTNGELQLIYADFSHCTFELPEMMILPSNSNQLAENLSAHDSINILLLSQTDVDKVLFINAFANYRTYQTFNQAQVNQPVLFRSLSSTMMLENQQVDQTAIPHCKSYLFDLEDSRKVRMIDTPGLGDGENAEQEQLAMEHIVAYVNQLSHLNAVCFLFQSSATQLDSFFRVCFTPPLEFLSTKARRNLLFCCINTCADGVSLPEPIFRFCSTNQIPLHKENIFYFDHELMQCADPRQTQSSFQKNEQLTYEKAWISSVSEANRLIEAIQIMSGVCHLHEICLSLKQTELQIIPLIRPISESIRHLLRNNVLETMYSPRYSLELRPILLHRTAKVCRACKPTIYQSGQLWLTQDVAHEIHDQCYTCSCAIEEHSPIDYLIEYEGKVSHINYHRTPTRETIDQLCNTSAEFAYFLLHAAHAFTEDPFLQVFTQMIAEEAEHARNQSPAPLNSRLMQDLTDLKRKYEELMDAVKKYHQYSTLIQISKSIQMVSQHPLIRVQLDAVKHSRKIVLKQYEFALSTNADETPVAQIERF